MQPMLITPTVVTPEAAAVSSASRGVTPAGGESAGSDFDSLVNELTQAAQEKQTEAAQQTSPPTGVADGEEADADASSDAGTLMAGLLQAMGLTLGQSPAQAPSAGDVAGGVPAASAAGSTPPDASQVQLSGIASALLQPGGEDGDAAGVPMSGEGASADQPGVSLAAALTGTAEKATAGEVPASPSPLTQAQTTALQGAVPVPAAAATGPGEQMEAPVPSSATGKTAAVGAPKSAGHAADPLQHTSLASTRPEEPKASATGDAPAPPTSTTQPVPDVAGLLSQTSGQIHARDSVHAASTLRAASQAHASPATQLVGRIEQAVAEGQTTLTVRLDPESLGRVEVRLDVQDGRVTALISADRQATLDLLQRDTRTLEKALAQGGLQLQSDGLQFSLREGNSQWAENEFGRRAVRVYGAEAEAQAVPDLLSPAPIRSDSLVDIQI